MHIKQHQNEMNMKVYKTPPCGRSVYSLRQFKMITHLEKNKVRGLTTERILVF